MKSSKTEKKPKEHLSVNELLALLPDSEIEKLTAELDVDKWVRKLKAVSVFKLVLFTLLSSERMSLRVMEENYKDPLYQALVPALASDDVSHVGIRGRLMKMNSEFCKKLYEHLYNQVSSVYKEATLEGYHIKRYDSTLIATFAHLLKGMKVGNSDNDKTQVKLTCEMTDDFLIRMDFHKDQAHLSEETALKESILKYDHNSTDIVVFDKGLKSRKTFTQLDTEGTLFVGRLNSNVRYKLLHPHWQDDGSNDTDELEFIQDSIVQLYEKGTKVSESKLRLVQFRLKKTNETLSFITNVLDISAHSIAEVYRSRWDIEVLFRFMKQEMNLTHFVCNDLNGIQVMLYFTLIASILVLIYKKKNNINSYKLAKTRFFKELHYSIIIDLVETPESAAWFKEKIKEFLQRE